MTQKKAPDKSSTDKSRQGRDPQTPGGTAQFDASQQTHREDMEDEEGNGEGQPMRGSLPPGTSSDRYSAQAPAVPGSAVDRGEKPTRDGQLGA